MSIEQILLLLYLLLPFGAAFLPAGARFGAWLSKGALSTGLRILILLFFIRLVALLGEGISIRAVLLNGYPIDVLLVLDPHRYGFLLIAEFCFLLAHWMAPASGSNSGMIRVLVSFAQGFCSLLVLSNNAIATGAFLLLSGAVFFYLVRFSISSSEDEAGAAISTRLHVLFYLLGVIMIAWGITEFSGAGLIFSRINGSLLGLALWMSLLVLALPLPPWSRWFARSLEVLPEGVSLTLVIYLSAVALKVTSLFSVVYPELGWQQKFFLYCIGALGCCLSLGGLFASESRRRMLGCIPSFFFGIVLLSLGVSKSTLVLSAYFACLFIPVFTSLILAASVMSAPSRLQKIFLGLLFVLVLGLPGTPVYQIFSGIGARSLDLGIGYSVAFGLLWFFYFNANAYMCRRIFMDEGAQGGGSDAVRLEGVAGVFAGYGIFLMLLLILVTQIAGRVL